MTKELAREGRPTKYKPEFCDTVLTNSDIKAFGATDSAIAAALSVDRATIFRWRDEYPDFAAACEEAKRIANDRVKQSLFARATGYDNPNAVKIFMPQGSAAPVYAPFTEHYPPDVGAAFNWLKNREPAEWRDRVEHTGADGKDLPAGAGVEALEIVKAIGLALRVAAERMAGDDAKTVNAKTIDHSPTPASPKRGEKP
jgi:hypothetical protein